MPLCHTPIPPDFSESIAMVGFTDYKWYCPHNPALHKKLKKIGKYLIPILPSIAAAIYIIDYFSKIQ